MNKSWFALVFVLLCVGSPVLKADFYCDICPWLEGHIYCDIEARIAAFFPREQKFKDVYGDVWPSYQLQATMSTCSFLELWTTFDYIHATGRQNHCDRKDSKLNLSTWAIGLQWPFVFTPQAKFYIGVGPTIAYAHIKNTFACHRDGSRLAFGGTLNSGFNYVFPCGIVTEIFADYIYQPMNFGHSRHCGKCIDMGGFKTGLGLGLQF